MEQQNVLTMHLQAHAHDAYQKWNDIVDAVKEVVIPLVDLKVSDLAPKVVDIDGGVKKLSASIRWDILGACVEIEYAEFKPPSYFSALMNWYLAGRFPCGWGEVDENGKICLLGPSEDGNYNWEETDAAKIVEAEVSRVYSPKVYLPDKGKLIVY
jgi:hypothetical protein